MESTVLLELVKKMTAFTSFGELAKFFALEVQEALDTGSVALYLCDHNNHELIPTAVSKRRPSEWPRIPMDEVDNPLIYALISAESCYVENVSRLVDVGFGFEQYRRMMLHNDSMIVYPLFDSRKQSLGILAIQAKNSALDEWRNDEEWCYLRSIFKSLFALTFSYQHQSDSTRVEKAYSNEQWARRVKDQTRRFIEMEYVGRSSSSERVRNELLSLADSTRSVLITGETGVGKDYVASLLHKVSPRKGAFIPVNCAAIAKELIESELFGSVKGAFTGAQNREGLVAAAHKGTLFLDEIGDMPMATQVSLLRLLNEKKYRPIGSNKELVSDFRLLCATHQPLAELVSQGKFREDLYFRIRQAVIDVAPLRERQVDMGELCRFIIQQFNQDFQTKVIGIESEAIDLFRLHTFPGNIRELRSLMLAACEKTSPGAMINKEVVTEVLSSVSQSALLELPSLEIDSPPDQQDLRKVLYTDDLAATLEDIEKRIIEMRLEMSQGSKAIAAQSLGVAQRTFSRRCQRWNL